MGLFQSVPSMLGALACLGRIQAFLEKDEREDFRLDYWGSPSEKEGAQRQTSSDSESKGADQVLSISGGNFGWSEDKMNLSDMNLSIPARQLTMIVGPIASGKSTLCKALLGETPVSDGQVILGRSSRRIGFCDQNTFLSNASIKENIIGLSPFNKDRYNEVIEAAMLKFDFLTLPKGDNTNVGSNGITLSGGQKQRVSIARALYLDTDFFIFDDILSGLDADTEEQVFLRVFGPDGIIKQRNATAVLCTHSIRHLPSADRVVAVGPDGTIVEQGTFEDLVANQKYIHSLGIKVKSPEQKSLGSAASVKDEDAPPDLLLRAKTTTDINAGSEKDGQTRLTGDRSVYKHYFQSVGFWPVFWFFMIAVVCGFFYNWTAVWIDFWSAGLIQNPPAHSNSFYLGLFALFQVFGLLTLFIVILICLKWIIYRSGSSLHKAALHTVINAPLRFFTTTDTGIVINIFSQDMTLIDGDLPIALNNVALDIALCGGMAAVIATSSPYLAVSYPFLIVILTIIQRFYLRTSRQLRLLDLEAKSPL